MYIGTVFEWPRCCCERSISFFVTMGVFCYTMWGCVSEAASGGLMGVIGGNMLAERYVNTEDLKYFVRLVK